MDNSPQLPLKPMVFNILVVLLDGARHGYSIVRELEEQHGDTIRLEPGNLYRTLRNMLRDGLIEETEPQVDPEFDDDRRRYFRVTPYGKELARAEAHRLNPILDKARKLNLLEGR